MTDNFTFLGDICFAGNDSWLEFRIPVRVLKSLINGPSSQHLQIERHEIVGLLRAIEQNQRTSEDKRKIVRDLLKQA
jgi:hypothetical protein